MESNYSLSDLAAVTGEKNERLRMRMLNRP